MQNEDMTDFQTDTEGDEGRRVGWWWQTVGNAKCKRIWETNTARFRVGGYKMTEWQTEGASYEEKLADRQAYIRTGERQTERKRLRQRQGEREIERKGIIQNKVSCKSKLSKGTDSSTVSLWKTLKIHQTIRRKEYTRKWLQISSWEIT